MKILSDVGEAFKEAKKNSLGKSVAVLLVVAILLTVTAVVFSWRTVGSLTPLLSALPIPGLAANLGAVGGQVLGLVAVSTFIVVLLGGLFLGWVYQIVLKALGGKGGLVEGVSVLAYSSVPLAVGSLLAVLVGFIPHTLIATLVGFILFAAFAALGFAAVYRGTKDLFGVDTITAFVAVTVFGTVVASALFGSLLLSGGLSNLGALGGLGGLGSLGGLTGLPA